MTILYRKVTILDNGQIWKVEKSKKPRKPIQFSVSLLLFISIVIFICTCTTKMVIVRADAELNSAYEIMTNQDEIDTIERS